MNERKIVVARHAATLQPCVLCRTPNPPERLSPGRLCQDCWVKEGAPGGWVIIPQGMVMVPVQALAQANFGAAISGELLPYCGERGVEEPPLMALRRLLEERERLAAWETDESVIPARCCYCRELFEHAVDEVGYIVPMEIAPANLASLADAPGLPVVWACRDRDACKARINVQVAAKFATAGQKAN